MNDMKNNFPCIFKTLKYCIYKVGCKCVLQSMPGDCMDCENPAQRLNPSPF